MTIPSVGFDMVIKPKIAELGRRIGEQMRDKCRKCGTWFLGNSRHQDENLCIECAGKFISWDRKLRTKRQLVYSRYQRVKEDRRRKENKGNE